MSLSSNDLGPIVWIGDDRSDNPEVVGNKAAQLGALRRRGYSVPDGFCLPLFAWSRPSWRDNVRAAAKLMPAPWVARSSTTVEDGMRRAFPGIFKTVLGILEIGALLAAIDAIHSGQGDDAVSAYAARLGDASHTIRLAVLVQPLVVADTAGVAFSRHPVTGASEVYIEANYGLGETVVDGSVTPDSYVERDGAVGARGWGPKTAKLVASPQGATRRLTTTTAERESLVLSDDQVLQIGQMVRRAEHDLGVPTDMEWAFAADRLVLLQARPITGLPSSPARTDRSSR